MKGAVVIISGGLDSTVLLHYVARNVTDYIIGVSFDYGQKHKKELTYAEFWGKAICTEHHIVPLPFLNFIGQKSALLSKNIHVPKEHYTHQNQRLTVVPNRNMIMLSIAVALAEANDISAVFYGPHKNDFTIYPDCRPDFVNAISQASILGTYNRVQINAPFVHLHKRDIVTIGKRLKVDFTKTWSCYEGGDLHCGKCGTCQERIEASTQAEVEDPTVYV